MLELRPSLGQHGDYHLSVAGDTYNTAIGLAQLGVTVEYVTALGRNKHSATVLEHAVKHQVGTQFIQRIEGATPGLYLIDNDDQGERYFSYWRRDSAAHQMLRDPENLAQALAAIEHIPTLFISGITLALCGKAGRHCLLNWLPGYRTNGGQVIYDSNYRPALWPDLESARQAHYAVLDHVDRFMPSAEDIAVLHRDGGMLALTSDEIVMTDGAAGITLTCAGEQQHIDVERVSVVTDTTGAGDAFNAGYIAARCQQLDAATAVLFAAEVAAQTIQQAGAILAESAWRELKLRLDQLR